MQPISLRMRLGRPQGEELFSLKPHIVVALRSLTHHRVSAPFDNKHLRNGRWDMPERCYVEFGPRLAMTLR